MAKKRNIARADGRIAVQVYLGVVDGKRKYKTVYGATQKEADAKALNIKMAMKKGIDVNAERDTFKQWSDHFISIKKLDVSASQMVSYNSYVKHLSVLDYLPLSKIRAGDIQDIINSLAAENPNTHKPTAKKTLNDVKMTASQIFALAIESRVLDYNPALSVKIPQRAPQSHRRALTDEEQHWVLDTPHRAQRAAMIMMYAGLRRGELIPLTWSDINLKAKTLSINKAVEMIDCKPVPKDMTKTPAGIRTIDIPQRLADFLSAQKKDNILVCPAVAGNMLTESSWSAMWESYMTDLNFKYGNRMDKTGKRATSKFNRNGIIKTIPPITAHWLRHTFATLLYISGVDVLVAKDQLGHEDVKTTLQIYTHLDKTYKRNSMRKLDDYLSNASQMQVSEK